MAPPTIPSGSLESSKRKSTFDLKDQLSDLQSKLSQSQQGSNIRKKRVSGSHLGELIDNSSEENNAALSKLPNVFSKKSKDTNKRNSLPAMPLGPANGAGSNSGSGKLGNDVNFVVGLSENLLLECRRLTAENSQYKQQLKDLESDLQRVTKQMTNISVINKRFIQEEEHMKDKNWELESTLQEVKRNFEKLQNDHSKLSQNKNDQDLLNEKLNNEVELQKLLNIKLTSELTSVKQQWANETKHFKTINEQLNDENDQLHKNVSELKDEIQTLKNSSKRLTATIPTLNDSDFFKRDDSNSDNEFSVLDDLEASPIKDAPSRNIELEKETLQSNLVHSNKTIAKLRSVVLKLRSDKDDLERQLALANISGNVSATYGSPVNKNRKLKNTLRSPPSLLSNRTSKALSVYESEDTTANDNWEDFSFSNSPDRALAQNASSSEDDENEGVPEANLDTNSRSAEDHVKRTLLSQELETDPAELAQKFARDNNLVLVDAEEYNRLKKFDDEDLAIPVEVLQQKCSKMGYVLLQSDDYEELVAKANYEPTEEELIDRVMKTNKMMVLPIDEHTKLIEKASYEPTEQELIDKVVSTDKVVLTQGEHNELLAKAAYEPTEQELIDRVSSTGKVVLPLEEHENLVNKASYEPSEEELVAKLSKSDKVVLPLVEHKNLIEKASYEPTETELIAKLNKLDKVVLPLVEHKNLLEKATYEPTESELIAKLNKANKVVLPLDEHSQLVEKASYEPTEEELIERVTKTNKVVVLPVDEHQNLVKSVEHPSLEALKSKLLEHHNHVAIDESEYSSLKTPSLDQLSKHATQNDHTLVPLDEHNSLKQKLLNPTIDDLKLHSAAADHLVIPKSEYQSLQDQIAKPSSSKLYQYATAAGLVLLNKSEHTKLSETSTNPSVLFLSAKLGALGYDVIQKSELEKLKELANESLHSKAEKEGHVAVPKLDLNSLHLETAELKKSLDSPELNYLQEKAVNHGHVVVASEHYQALKESDETPLAIKVQSKNQVLLDAAEHQSLLATVQNPSRDLITEKASGLGLHVVDDQTYENFIESKKIVDDVPQDFLVTNAETRGFKLVPKEDFDVLKSLESREGVEKVAAKHELAVIPSVELEKLEALNDKISKLTTEDVTEFGKQLNLKVLPSEEHELLTKLAHNPDVDQLKQHEKSLGVVVVPETDYSQLRDLAHNPPLQHLEDKASQLGHKLVDDSTHSDLTTKALNPDLDHVQQMAKTHDHVTLPSKELLEYQKQIEEPTLDYMEAKSQSLGFSLIEKQRLSELEESFKETIEQKAAKINSVLVPKDELQELKTTASNPSVPFLQQKAEALGYELILQEEAKNITQKIESPTADYIQKKAAYLGLVTLPSSEHDTLVKKASSPEENEIKKFASDKGLVVIPQSEYELLVSPPIEVITEKLSALGYSIIPSVELADLKQKIKDPELDYIHSSAGKLGHVVLPVEQHDELKRQVESPVVEELESKLSLLNYKLLPVTEYESLNAQLNETLEEKARKLDSLVIPVKEYSELKKIAEEPLDEKAKNLNFVLLPSADHLSLVDEHSKLTEQLNNPTEVFLTEKATGMGYNLVSQDEHALLLASNAETLEEKASKEGLVLLPREKLVELEKTVESPDLEFLTSKLSALSCSVISTLELEDLQNKVASPSDEQLNKYVSSRGSVILPKEKHDEFVAKTTTPSLDFVKESASLHNHTVVDSFTFENLTKSNEEALEDKARRHNSVIIPQTDYKRLSMLQESPSVEFLREKAEGLGYELVPVEELQRLQELDSEPLLSKANKQGMILLSTEDYESLKGSNDELEKKITEYQEKLQNPDELTLTQGAAGLGLVLLKEFDYKTLLNTANSPPLEHIVAHAQKKEHVVIPQWKHEILQRKSTSPSEDEIRDFAKASGFSVIENNELARLHLELAKPSRDTLTKAAGVLGLSLVPVKEYELLKAKFESSTAVGTPKDLTDRDVFEAPESPSVSSPLMSPNSYKSKVMSSKERFEEMIRQENEKKENQKASAAKALGLVTLSTDEYKRLVAQQQITEPTISDIYNGAKGFGLAVLPQADYKALLKKQSVADNAEDLEAAARLLGFTIIPLGSSGRRSIGSLDAANQSTSSFTEDDEFHDAVSHMSSKVSLVSTDEYEDALSRPLTHNSEFEIPLTAEALEAKAIELGFKLTPAEETDDEDDVTSIEDNLEADTTREIPVDRSGEVEALESELKAKDAKIAELGALESELKLKDAKIAELGALESELKLKDAKIAELEVLESEIKTKEQRIAELENKKISEYEIIQIAPEYGLVAISQEVYDELQKEPDQDKLEKVLNSRGLVLVESDKHQELVEGHEKSKEVFTLSSLGVVASGLGAAIISNEELSGLIDNDSRNLELDHITKLAQEKGLVAIPQSTYSELTKELSDEKIQEIASSRGLIVLNQEAYSELQESAEKSQKPLSESQVQLFLTEHGLISLTKKEYDNLNVSSTESNAKSVPEPSPDTQKVTEISIDQLEQRAKDLDMSLISSKELQVLKNRQISANDLAIRAAQLDLVLVSQQAYDDLRSTSVSGNDIVETASKLGYLCIPETAYIPTTVAPVPDVQNVVVLPKTYYNKLARSHSLSVERISKEDLVKQCKKRGILLADDINLDLVHPTDDQSKALSQGSPQSSYQFKASTTPVHSSPIQEMSSPGSNMRSSPSLFSIATNVSLTDRRMIPALTQTIIGEYIYKYYRRLGPFSSISENRHERYFWIHPYSLTLYWSASNPVIGDPSTNKIRAAAILKVEVVEDNNPLPPGLYHKSIIVHSPDRSIKITCPTRQRHNVWYNSLRYLIERTTEGLDFTGIQAPEQQGQSKLLGPRLTPTIEEDEDGEDNDIDTYRYMKPRSSLVQQRSVSNPTKKSSRLFSSSASSMHRSSTSGSLHKKRN